MYCKATQPCATHSHSGSRSPYSKVLHRDFKPSNVLLDVNLHAKLSDVGLAKAADTEMSSQRQKSSSRVARNYW